MHPTLSHYPECSTVQCIPYTMHYPVSRIEHCISGPVPQVMDVFEKAEVKFPYGASGPAKKAAAAAKPAAKPSAKEKPAVKKDSPKKEPAKKAGAKKPAAKKGTIV